MDILIRTDGVKLNEKLLKAVRSKIGRVHQYAPRALGVRVQLVRVGASRQYRVHVLYNVRGNDVSAQHVANDPVVALDLASKKIERRLRKRKTAALAQRVRHCRKQRQIKPERFISGGAYV